MASTHSEESVQSAPKKVKLVLVGDSAVGKSSLIRNYLENSFTDEYEPTVLDVYRGVKSVKKTQIDVEIHDTSGDAHLQLSRSTQYKNADVFMICVAADNMDALASIPRWVDEIRSVESKPIILILTKKDLIDETQFAV